VWPMQAKVDDVADAQYVDISQLRFGRLTGCGYPVIEPTPIVNGFRIGHYSLDFGLGGGARRGTRLMGADSFPRISNPRFPSASRAFDVALPDRRPSFSSLVFSMPYLICKNWIGIIPDPLRSC
jgi:hypothetical protein